ncbi:MAG TPA: hypothetical protein VI750_13485 [Pyrinomonadaceae bacterium]|nr:hypothetical protein [Pyrinomonadaceae bacterium]
MGSATRKRALGFTGWLLVGIWLGGSVFPMHLRDAERTITDTMHKSISVRWLLLLR